MIEIGHNLQHAIECGKLLSVAKDVQVHLKSINRQKSDIENCMIMPTVDIKTIPRFFMTIPIINIANKIIVINHSSP